MQVRGPLVSIYPDHVVTFSPPGSLKIRYRQITSDVVTSAAGLQDDVIVIPSQLTLVDDIGIGRIDLDLVSPSPEGIGPAKLGVKIPAVWLRLAKGLIVNVEVLLVRLFAFVDQLDNGTFFERHACVAVQCTSLVELVVVSSGCRKKERLEAIDNAVSQEEEVTEGDNDTRSLCVVPRHLEKAFSIVVPLGHPYVRDSSRPLDVCKDS